MGNEVGVYDEHEVQDLSPEERKQLKKYTLEQLHASSEVRDLISKNPKLVTTFKDINNALRGLLDPRLQRIKDKLPPE